MIQNEIDTMLNDYNETINQLNEIKKIAQEKTKVVLKEGTKAIFENSKVTWIGWTQYTPYFNDGNECVFSVNELYYGYDEDPSEVYSPYDGFHAGYRMYLDGKPEHVSVEEFTSDFKEMKIFSNAIESIPSDVMRSAFGDHAFVIITKEGVQIIYYEHE
jgi:hypothetical protein